MNKMKKILEKFYKREVRFLCKLPRTKLVQWQLRRLYKKIDKLTRSENGK